MKKDTVHEGRGPTPSPRYIMRDTGSEPERPSDKDREYKHRYDNKIFLYYNRITPKEIIYRSDFRYTLC